MDEDTTQEFPKNSLAIILARFESLESSVNSRMDSLESQFKALDEKVDRRLMETRPIWQQVLARLDSVDSRLDSMEEDFEQIGLKFRTFQNDLLRMQTQDERLADRIEKLANPPAPQ
jgi:DNA repair exonuclease SbcCD ATPase subunit